MISTGDPGWEAEVRAARWAGAPFQVMAKAHPLPGTCRGCAARVWWSANAWRTHQYRGAPVHRCERNER